MTQDPANAAFQSYPVVTEQLVSELPDGLTFEQGAVLPLAISTACAGLYRKDYLGLPLPQVENVTATGQTLLVWGGSSSVGATAIQLAVASGLTVISTASSENHDFVKSLGANAVFDYRSDTVVEDIVNALGNAKLAGVYDAISEGASFKAVAAILDGLNATVNVACVLPYDQPTERFAPKYGKPVQIPCLQSHTSITNEVCRSPCLLHHSGATPGYWRVDLGILRAKGFGKGHLQGQARPFGRRQRPQKYSAWP